MVGGGKWKTRETGDARLGGRGGMRMGGGAGRGQGAALHNRVMKLHSPADRCGEGWKRNVGSRTRGDEAGKNRRARLEGGGREGDEADAAAG